MLSVHSALPATCRLGPFELSIMLLPPFEVLKLIASSQQSLPIPFLSHLLASLSLLPIAVTDSIFLTRLPSRIPRLPSLRLTW